MNPYIIIAFLLALAATGLGGVHYGKKLEHDEWTTRELDIQTKATAKIQQNRDDVLKAEHDGAEAIAGASTYYQKEIARLKREKDAAAAADHTGGLYVTANCPAGGNQVPGTAAPTGGSDGAAVVRLSDEAADFLESEASRADSIVAQLTLAQQTIEQYRKTCKMP